MSTDAFRAYKSTRVNTASPGDLLLMLFDAAVRHGNAGIEALNARENERAHHHLVKTQAIVSELMASLNFEIEFSNQLYQLYEYCNHCLMQANLHKDSDHAMSAVNILKELRETWHHVIKGGRNEEQPVLSGVSSARPALSYGVGGDIEFAR